MTVLWTERESLLPHVLTHVSDDSSSRGAIIPVRDESTLYGRQEFI